MVIRDVEQERLSRLEGTYEQVDRRLDDTNSRLGGVQRAIDGLRAEMNSRFEEVNSRFEAMNQAIDGLRSETNRAIDGLRAEMNSRFEETNSRFDGLRSEMNSRFEETNSRFEGDESGHRRAAERDEQSVRGNEQTAGYEVQYHDRSARHRLGNDHRSTNCHSPHVTAGGAPRPPVATGGPQGGESPTGAPALFLPYLKQIQPAPSSTVPRPTAIPLIRLQPDCGALTY